MKGLHFNSNDTIKTDIKEMGFFRRIVGVVISPSDTMESLVRKPSLMFPILLIMFAPLLLVLIDYSSIESLLRNYVELANTHAKHHMSPKELDSFIKSSMYAIPVLLPFFLEIIWVAGTGVIFVIMKLFGSDGKFNQYLSITGYTLVIAVIGFLFMALVSFVTGNIGLRLSLDILLSNTKGSYFKGFMSGMLGAIDLFSIWFISVLGIGIMRVSELSKKKVYTILIATYTIISIINAMMAGSSAVS